MTLHIAAAVEELRRTLTAAGHPERALGEKAYLKSALSFLGVGMPGIRQAGVAFCAAHPELDREDLRELSRALYATDVHELHSVAIAILERRRDLLAVDDLPWLIDRVRASGSWAYVDWLATKVIGHLIARSRSNLAYLDQWAADGDFWVRRTALLAQLDALRAGGGDFDSFARIAAPMLDETEFFIRKAIGWVLRDVSRKRPELTFGFLQRHLSRVSGLTLREGQRHLPEALRSQLVAPPPSRRKKPRC